MKIAFETWAQLLDHIHAGYLLWYQAPLSYYPAQVNATVRKDGKVRVYPIYDNDCDPFTADEAHLSRFRKIAQ